jgi:hypothetical protein
MRNRTGCEIISYILVFTSATISYASVFTYIPNVPWSQEKQNGAVGREFKIYCTRSDKYASLGFIQLANKLC